jgi:hypothetical protein
MHYILNEWGVAKGRITEDINTKHERLKLASNPEKIGVTKRSTH